MTARSRPAWVALGTVAALAADATTEHYDPALGMIMIVCDVGVPALLALVLVSVILFGGDDRENRAFRLLRWIRDKPEPPGPPEPPVKSRPQTEGASEVGPTYGSADPSLQDVGRAATH